MKYEVLNVNDLEVDFIHLENGENRFDDKGIALLLGIPENLVSQMQRNIDKELGTNPALSRIRLKHPKTGRMRKYSEFSRVLVLAGRTKSDKGLKLVGIAGQLLNEKFNIEAGFTKSNTDNEILAAQKNIARLHKMEVETTRKAFEAAPNAEYHRLMDEARMYGNERRKRELQLKNLINCKNRMNKEVELNQKGFLTESSEIPELSTTYQSRLINGGR